MSDVEEKVTIKCRHCGGTGKRQELDYFGGFNVTSAIECAKCDGTGYQLVVKDY
jgi:DnaJ-class molecular chaperone